MQTSQTIEMIMISLPYAGSFALSVVICWGSGRRAAANREHAMLIRERAAAAVAEMLAERAGVAKELRSEAFAEWEAALPGIARRQAW